MLIRCRDNDCGVGIDPAKDCLFDLTCGVPNCYLKQQMLAQTILPRKKIPPNLRSLARAHTEMGVKVLAGIASAEDAPPAARVSAAQALLDRGWGKAPQRRAPARTATFASPSGR